MAGTSLPADPPALTRRWRQGSALTVFRDEDDFGEWLRRDGRDEIALVLAARIAARAAPLLAGLKPDGQSLADDLGQIVVWLQGVVIASAAARFPARLATIMAEGQGFATDVFPDALRSAAARAAGRAILRAALLPSQVGTVSSSAPTAAAMAFADADNAFADGRTIPHAVSLDVQSLMEGAAPRELAFRPLWDGEAAAATKAAWDAFKALLIVQDEGAAGWIAVYEGIRNGQPADESSFEPMLSLIADREDSAVEPG